MFEPRVLISDISDSKTTLSVRIWIREIDKKDEIISEFLGEIIGEIQRRNHLQVEFFKCREPYSTSIDKNTASIGSSRNATVHDGAGSHALFIERDFAGH